MRTTASGSAALSTAVLPYFLLGASSVAVRGDLGISDTAIGAVGTVLFVSAALAAAPAGRLVERIGPSLALKLGVIISGVAAASIGIAAHAWWQLAVPMVTVGFAMALIDTGAARAFADHVLSHRQGLAFGVKEASIPAASMLAGLSLPTLAALLGWRASFLAALVVAGLVVGIVPSRKALERRTPHGTHVSSKVGSPALVRLAIGAGLGTGAATAATTFLVSGGVSAGLSADAAGLVLALASVTGVAIRLSSGAWADRPGARPVRGLTVLLAAGAVGAALLAAGGPTWVFVVAAVAVLGAGWGWSGLAFLTAVRANPSSPAAAAGVLLTGLGAGGAMGPLAFGAITDRGSFTVAWTCTAVAFFAASLVTASARAGLDAAGTDRTA